MNQSNLLLATTNKATNLNTISHDNLNAT